MKLSLRCDRNELQRNESSQKIFISYYYTPQQNRLRGKFHVVSMVVFVVDAEALARYMHQDRKQEFLDPEDRFVSLSLNESS